MPWVAAGATIICQECLQTVPKKSGTHVFCQECQKARLRLQRKQQRASKPKFSIRGRVCSECGASDAEKTWRRADDKVCRACFHAFLRGNMVCRRCQHIGGSLGCVYCTSPTPGRIDVTLVSKKTERTRVIRRHYEHGSIETAQGKRLKVNKDDPVLWVEHDVFLAAKR